MLTYETEATQYFYIQLFSTGRINFLQDRTGHVVWLCGTRLDGSMSHLLIFCCPELAPGHCRIWRPEAASLAPSPDGFHNRALCSPSQDCRSGPRWKRQRRILSHKYSSLQVVALCRIIQRTTHPVTASHVIRPSFMLTLRHPWRSKCWGNLPCCLRSPQSFAIPHLNDYLPHLMHSVLLH